MSTGPGAKVIAAFNQTNYSHVFFDDIDSYEKTVFIFFFVASLEVLYPI